jgi:hypothetical protein
MTENKNEKVTEKNDKGADVPEGPRGEMSMKDLEKVAGGAFNAYFRRTLKMPLE